jgi:hypothetical protein
MALTPIVSNTAVAPPIPHSLQGVLVFDNGAPAAAVTARLYTIGFAGKDTLLGEAKSGAQGSYSFSYSLAVGIPANLQVRVLNAAGQEVTISNTLFNAGVAETLNLVVPISVLPLAPEYTRLATDMQTHIGGIANLAQAQEDATRQDLTLVTQNTSWDARLVALAATAAQQATAVGLGQDVLYALFRIGLPTDPTQLAMVPAATIKTALAKASSAGIVSLNTDQIATATTEFQTFATNTGLKLTTPGGVSSFSALIATVPAAQQTAFANLYFNLTPGEDASLWTQAAALNIPATTLQALQLQGKFLHLTFNNAALAQKLAADIGSAADLSHLADKNYHQPATWSAALTALAGSGGDAALGALIPAIYTGANNQARLAAYSADMARKVRVSFPTRVAAQMLDNKELVIPAATGTTVTNLSGFLRAAEALGYELGRTPLNRFLLDNPKTLPALDGPTTASLKTLHRLHQVTPSDESRQAALTAGFTSAFDIASHPPEEFTAKYSAGFPSAAEASLTYAQSQQSTSVVFNFFAMAKQLDTSAPVYALSGSSADRQNAKNAIVQQFPTMATLFGSMDFCQCADCRSVLSPAAYFVDLLEYLRKSGANAATCTPLDVLIGNPPVIAGRRPDLGALPLTCENTNTAMPYIDLVNEILEYFIANNKLDGGAAYDTGTATTAQLTAEPQHVLPQVYSTTLKQAEYPLGLPFDLWIETVRGFMNYYKTPLAPALETLRPVDHLELFTDANNHPYYRAQIYAEALGLAPVEYAVLTTFDLSSAQPSVQNWFKLYGYGDQNTALNGQVDASDPSQFIVPPLKSAENLSQLLGLTYQELTDLVTTGFLNPSLYALIFQFNRLGLNISDAFSYTSQPGYAALSATDAANFAAQLTAITAAYKPQYPSFDAATWLKGVLPANFSKSVLVLADPDSGCDFTSTTLQYADGSAAQPLDFLKLSLFVRLWKKLGWSLRETDRALQTFFPASTVPAWSAANFASAFSSAWKTALVYLAHLDDLNTRLAPAMGRVALLPLWTSLSVHGENPPYAQLFLTSSVLNNDAAFDDPNGLFPGAPTDPLANHQTALQGVLGLTAVEVADILADAGTAVTTVTTVSGPVPNFSLTNISICYRYSTLAKCLQLSVEDMISLRVMSGLNPFRALSGNPLAFLADDILSNSTLAFVKQVGFVGASGFTVEDLQYLLRQQFDPVGEYAPDPNALITLVQSLASGLQQIQAQEAVPSDLMQMPESLVEQSLSGLIPATILQPLFTQLSNTQTYTASQGGVAPANQIDPTPFASVAGLTFAYDSTTETQSISYTGVLQDWQKASLVLLNASPLFAGLLAGLEAQVQATFAQSVGNILGVWSSMAEYEAVLTGVVTAVNASPLTAKDPALSLSYDQADKLQWLAYRGVLTDAKKAILTGIDNSASLATLLNNVQAQAMPAYRSMLGAVLAMMANAQTYQATQTGVAAATQISAAVFAGNPAIHVSYNAASETQTLTYQGALTDASRVALGALIPASTTLAALLQTVRNQAVQLFQNLAINLLTVTAADLDTFVQPLLGSDPAAMQRLVKAELVNVFLPLQAQMLSTGFILQGLASNLGANLSLTSALATDTALLTDPSNPGSSLLGAFLGVGQQGVSATYYASANRTGAALAMGTAATAATTDSTNPNAGKAGTGSAHFEGYLQVSTDGPYRFFAELGNAGVTAAFDLDSPDPTSLFTNPIISPLTPAAADNTELSQFVDLKGGAAYHFTLDFGTLGANGASLLIQGENLPKGPLAQVILYPQQAVAAFARAQVLLAKVLQILQVTGLDEREVAYLAANAASFNDFNLSLLPTEASDDSVANAVVLFSQFLTLADYANLRNGPAGKTDGLIDVFENVGQVFAEAAGTFSSNLNPAAPWTALANLTRRDPQVVRELGKYFGFVKETTSGTSLQVTALGDFADDRGVRRLWEALKLQQTVGIPVAALTAATAIVSAAPPSPDAIAANFKNAVKARYTADAWLPVAQSVFDPLRQKKRDALVAYLVNYLELENSNQLFEYFLVDPGMEPVVQTSRLRLAMSSVQTFIQRCLLNLEDGNTMHPERNVSPNAIDADWWQWMKRYRVWQANREIFLYPENWLIPELRLDQTDLFQAMMGSLLQGDVTSDLVEDSFLTYLKGLDGRARLDIVASYLDQNPTTPGVDTLHVLGRTYGHPHKYFYRTYSQKQWSPWIAVTPDIESDHIVMAIWKGRLNLFWVTFVIKALAPPAPPGPKASDPTLTGMKFNDLAEKVYGAAPQAQVQVQLHWCEYFQEKWSTRISTDINNYAPIDVFDGFTPDQNVYVHVAKEVDSSGNEGAVLIQLDVQLTNPVSTGKPHTKARPTFGYYGFRVTSKNCDPGFSTDYGAVAQASPYNAYAIDATLRTGSANLTSSFATNLQGQTSLPDTEQILDSVNNFALLDPGNPVAPPFIDSSEPAYWQAGSLVAPFFYKDTAHKATTNEMTFFVQPSLTETTITEWVGWAVPPPKPIAWLNPNLVDTVPVSAQVPLPDMGDPDPVYSIYNVQTSADWAVAPATVISYGGVLIGQAGGIDLAAAAVPATSVVNAPAAPASPVNANGLAVVNSAGLTLSHLQIISAVPGAALASTVVAG